MALVVEDGTGRSDAEAYVSVADFRTACGNRGLDLTGKSDTLIEQKLREAAAYLDTAWRFKGERSVATQALEFPRTSLIDWSGYTVTGVPKRVKDATVELAFKALDGSLFTDLDRGGRVKSESVGPISVTYADDAPAGKTFRAAERALAPYIRDPDEPGAPRYVAPGAPYFTTGMHNAPSTGLDDPLE